MNAAIFTLNMNNMKTTNKLCGLSKGVNPAIMARAKPALICIGDVSELRTRSSLMICENIMAPMGSLPVL